MGIPKKIVSMGAAIALSAGALTGVAAWAGRGRTSDLGYCLANVTARGAQYVV